MKLTTSLIALFTTATFATPTPSETPSKGAIVCNDRDFQGYCDHIYAPASQCVHIAGYSFDQVSSVKPDEGSFCYFFVGGDCNTDEDFFHVGYPGVADLSKTPVNGPVGSTRDFEDKINTYFCVDE